MIHKVRSCESCSILGLFLLFVTRVACEKRQNAFTVFVGPCAGCVGLHIAIAADASGGATTIRLHPCGEVELLWNVCLVATLDRDHTVLEKG